MFDLVARAQDALAAIGTLSEPEIAMLEAAQSGLERDCSPATDKSLKIRAVLVRWLLGYGYRPHLALAWAAAFVVPRGGTGLRRRHR